MANEGETAVGGADPGTSGVGDVTSGTGGPEDGAAERTPAPQQTEQPQPLADLIAEHRRSREAAKREAATRAQREARVAELEAELERGRASRGSILADPVGYLRAQGVQDDELPVVGEALMYHLMPDRAPANLRPRLLEAQMRRNERQRETEAATRAQREAAERDAAQYGVYVAALDASARAAPATENPYSRRWFGESHEEYVQSLEATARNLAAAAQEAGEVADLRPQNVMRVLEAHLAQRARRFEARAAEPDTRAGERTAETNQGVSTQRLNERGSARPPALTDEERIRRAVEALAAARPE